MADPWENLLNPDVLRQRFVRSGLFLLAHEMLENAIVNRLHDFYSDSWTAENGWEESEQYKEKVLSLVPKGKSVRWRSSIAWLQKMGAIDDNDAQRIHKLTDERNRLAHELRDVIGGSRSHDFDQLFPELAELVLKIDRWWVINVEIATDPDLMDKEIDEAEVQPGSAILLRMLTQIALGEDDEAWAYYKDFVAERGGTAKPSTQS